MADPMAGVGSGGPVESQHIARRLFMVYDAKAGWMSALKDSMMKVMGSGCSLCFVTHGLTGKRQETQDLEHDLGDMPLEYRHATEIEDIEARLGGPFPKPSVLVELEDGDVVVLMDPPAITRLRRLLEGAGKARPGSHREQPSLRAALKLYLASKRIASPLDRSSSSPS